MVLIASTPFPKLMVGTYTLEVHSFPLLKSKKSCYHLKFKLLTGVNAVIKIHTHVNWMV